MVTLTEKLIDSHDKKVVNQIAQKIGKTFEDFRRIVRVDFLDDDGGMIAAFLIDMKKRREEWEEKWKYDPKAYTKNGKQRIELLDRAIKRAEIIKMILTNSL